MEPIRGRVSRHDQWRIEIGVDMAALENLGAAFLDPGTKVEVKVIPPPTLIDLIRELREVVGLPSGALSITPESAWGEALDKVRDAMGKAAI